MGTIFERELDAGPKKLSQNKVFAAGELCPGQSHTLGLRLE